jgi:Fe-S cluster biogenesis protein NfuA
MSGFAALSKESPVLVLTEQTPNPDALKFIPDVLLTGGATYSFERGRFEPPRSPLAAGLFALPGVSRVFIAPDFVTVTRGPGAPTWNLLRYQVISIIADHLEAGAPAVAEPADTSSPEIGQDEVEAEIRQVLGLYVRPGVARDGGDVLFERFDADEGVLWIRMQGACGGCPSSRLTLKAGIETIVRRYVPEVVRVEEFLGDRTDEAPAGPSRLRRWIEGFGGGAGGGPRPVFTHAGRELPTKPANG